MIIIILIFIILSIHYFFFLFKILTGLKKLKKTSLNDIRDEFISVIVPFRNEAENICRSLNSLKNLNYPLDKYEIIYVDDNSTDNSYKLLESEKGNGNIKLLKLPGEIISNGNKKRAVEYGIKNSAGDIIITTDADCIHKKNWLRLLLNDFNPDTVFISGPVELEDDSSLFRKIQKSEFEGLVLAGAGLIGSGTPVICNGANIAYRKKVFEEANGFDDNIKLASGEDEMLMQKISGMKKGKIKFCWNKEALVRTESCKNLKEFLNQRKRWASKSLFYADKFLILRLTMIFLFYTGLIIQPVLIFWGHSFLWITFILSVIIKILLEFRIIKKGWEILTGRNNIFIFLLTELLHVPYIVFTALFGLFGNFEWKGRKIKR